MRSWKCRALSVAWAGSVRIGCGACVAPSTGPTRAGSYAAPAPAAEDGAEPRLFVTLGRRSLDDATFWEPVEDQGVLGLLWERPNESGLGWEAGLEGALASEEVLGVDVESSSVEFFGGGRKTWRWKRIRPYIGGGLTFMLVSADIGDGAISESDGAVGLYLRGGAYAELGDRWSLGLDVRRVFGTDVEFSGFVPTDADHDPIALTVGDSF